MIVCGKYTLFLLGHCRQPVSGPEILWNVVFLKVCNHFIRGLRYFVSEVSILFSFWFEQMMEYSMIRLKFSHNLSLIVGHTTDCLTHTHFFDKQA
jgi:hypothetical protein